MGRSRNIWAVPLEQPRAGHVDTLLTDRQWPVYFVTVSSVGYRQHREEGAAAVPGGAELIEKQELRSPVAVRFPLPGKRA